MSKRKYDDWRGRQRLSDAGWNVQKQDSVKFNAGSETLNHADLKLVVAWYFKQELGYRVDTEVSMPHGDVDVLAWNADDIVIVECETAPKEEVITDKINRYVKNQPPRECWVLNVNDAPLDLMERYAWVANEIGMGP